MLLVRLVRILIPLATLGLVACVLGCSGDKPSGLGVDPPSKEESKKIAEETKNSMREGMKARGMLKKGGH
jgi:hypothetical protein